MWSIRLKNGFFTVAFGCWCFQLVKSQQSQHMETPEVLLCDEMCEFSAWAMHAYCGERMLSDVPLECREAKTLDVRLNNIRNLRRGRLSEFENLKYLFLVGNNMSYVEDGAFEGCDGIQFLSWGGNNFPRLSTSKFVGLANLIHMLIDSSNLREIETGAFRETPLLKTLDLSGNKFISPPCDVLHSQNVLTDLYLSDNLISILPERCFSRFQHLTRLKLSNNPIRHITNLSAFEGLHSLKKLEMDNTSLTSLPVGSFRHIHTVTEFVISKNMIEVLEERDFATLPDVEVLRLDHNRIHTIHPRTFADLQSLKLLVLSNNKIISIGLHAFLPVETSLEELHLDGNQLRSIHNISTSSIQSLRKLSLARNPLECHCHLTTFRHSPSGMSSATEQPDALVTCILPDGHEVSVNETPITATPCPKPTQTPVEVYPGIGPTQQHAMLIGGKTTEKMETNETSASYLLLYVLIALMALTALMGGLLLAAWLVRRRTYMKQMKEMKQKGRKCLKEIVGDKSKYGEDTSGNYIMISDASNAQV